MTLGRTLLRVLTIVSAALAISVVPVARAFAEVPALPAAASAMSASHRTGSAHLAHRMPRLRKPKQSLFALIPGSRAFDSAEVSTRRDVPLRERTPRAASFALLPDHPPA